MDQANVSTILDTINLIEGCGRENVSLGRTRFYIDDILYMTNAKKFSLF